MPKTTIPANNKLHGDFLEDSELSSNDLVQVWDRSEGKWKWTTLGELVNFLATL